VQGDDREQRTAMMEQICDELDAAPVQHIGKLLVIWRPSDKEKVTLPKVKKA
jgi:RNA-binding protein